MHQLLGIHIRQETQTNSTKSRDERGTLLEGTIVEPHQHLSSFQSWGGRTTENARLTLLCEAINTICGLLQDCPHHLSGVITEQSPQ